VGSHFPGLRSPSCFSWESSSQAGHADKPSFSLTSLRRRLSESTILGGDEPLLFVAPNRPHSPVGWQPGLRPSRRERASPSRRAIVLMRTGEARPMATRTISTESAGPPSAADPAASGTRRLLGRKDSTLIRLRPAAGAIVSFRLCRWPS